MDQAQGNNTNDLQDQSNQPLNEPQGQQVPSTPIQVNFQTSEDTAAYTMNDPVMDGVPGQTEALSNQGTDMIAAAEAEVQQANPQTTDAELAAVATELENMANDVSAVPEVQEQPSGTNPMDQIMQQAAEEPTVNGGMPPTDSSFESQASTEAVTMTAPNEPMVNDGPVASFETTNEFGNDSAFSPEVSSNQNPQPEMPIVENNSLASNDSSSEVVSEQPSAPEPINEQNVDNNQLAVEPMSEATLTDQSSAETALESSSVVNPDAISAAVAAGTSGDNAITGSPETTSVDTAQASVQVAPMEHKQKTSRGLIITVVTLITLLFGGGAVAAYMLQPKNDEPATTSSTEQQSSDSKESSETSDATATPGETVAATTLDDYKAVCSGNGKVTNAAAYVGSAPHPIVVFEKGIDDKFAQSLVSFKEATWAVNSTKVDSGQLVACISRKEGSEVKLKDCNITDPTTKVAATVGLYSSSYNVNIFESLSGKLVTSFVNNSISTSCPAAASYSKADLKTYAPYDQIAFEASVSSTVTKVF